MESAGSLRGILGPMRIPFLILAPACVLVGVGTASWSGAQIEVWPLVLCFVGGIAAHVCVNAFNEYFDFRSGLDATTTRTPFSGGSGTLPEAPHLIGQALAVAVGAGVITAAIGGYFLVTVGFGILPIGALGLLVAVIYTPWLARSAFLCLIAPGLCFGPLMVVGTHLVLTGEFSWIALLASLVPFFLVSNLLLLNQFPDVEADTGVGRRHLPIAIGRRKSAYVYVAFLGLTYMSIAAGVIAGALPVWCLLGLATVPAAIRAGIGSIRDAEEIPKLIPAMGMNVILNLLTPILVAVGLLVA